MARRVQSRRRARRNSYLSDMSRRAVVYREENPAGSIYVVTATVDGRKVRHELYFHNWAYKKDAVQWMIQQYPGQDIRNFKVEKRTKETAQRYVGILNKKMARRAQSRRQRNAYGEPTTHKHRGYSYQVTRYDLDDPNQLPTRMTFDSKAKAVAAGKREYKRTGHPVEVFDPNKRLVVWESPNHREHVEGTRRNPKQAGGGKGVAEYYKTFRGQGSIESGKPRGPYLVGFKAPGALAFDNKVMKRLPEARKWLRSKLGVLRKGNPTQEQGRKIHYVEAYYGYPARWVIVAWFPESQIAEARRKAKELRTSTYSASGEKVRVRTTVSKGNPVEFARGKNPPGHKVTFDDLTQRQQKSALMAYRRQTGDRDPEDQIRNAVFYHMDWNKKTGKPWKTTARFEYGLPKHLFSKRNPNGGHSAQDADHLYQQFHGRGPKQTTEVRTVISSRDNLAELGELVELDVHLMTDEKVRLQFPKSGRNVIMLCSSPDGRQLYFEGGSQYVDLYQLGMSGRDWVRDHMALGVLMVVTYRTEKGFDKFELIDYFHKLGEVTGQKPVLNYDTINHLLSVSGGQYEIRPEGIVN